MKTITKIAASGLKGLTFTRDSGPSTVVIGKSFSGKTAILDAIKLGLLGYHPRYGKPANMTFDALGSGDALRVALEIEKTVSKIIGRSPDSEIEHVVGHKLIHEWKRERGSIKYSGPVELPGVPAVLFDHREFFQLSRPARLAYLFGRVDLSEKGWTPQAVMSALNLIVPDRRDGFTDGAQRDLIACAEDLEKHRLAEGASLQDYVTALTGQITARHKAAMQAAKQFAGLAQASTALAERKGPTARNVATLLTGLRAEQSKLESECGALKAQANIHADWQRRLQEAKRKAENTEDMTPALKLAEENLAKLKKQLNGWNYDALIKAAEAFSKADAEVNRLTSEYDTLARNRKSLDEQEEITKHKKQCPYCKSSRKGWQEHLLAECTEKRKEIDASLLKVNGQLTEAIKERVELDKTLNEEKKRDAKMRAVQSDVREQERKVSALRIESFAGQQAAADVKALENGEPPQPNADTLTKTERSLTELRLKVMSAEEEQRRWQRESGVEAQNLQALQSRRSQEATVEICNLALVTLRTIQDRMIEAAADGLLEKARAFTDGILNGPLCYRDNDIGYFNGQSWVSLGNGSFSGTEELLAGAALSVALAQDSPLRIVLLDELGVADRDTKRLIVQRMIELVKRGVIGQWIGCDNRLEDYDGIDGLTIVEVK